MVSLSSDESESDSEPVPEEDGNIDARRPTPYMKWQLREAHQLEDGEEEEVEEGSTTEGSIEL